VLSTSPIGTSLITFGSTVTFGPVTFEKNEVILLVRQKEIEYEAYELPFAMPIGARFDGRGIFVCSSSIARIHVAPNQAQSQLE